MSGIFQITSYADNELTLSKIDYLEGFTTEMVTEDIFVIQGAIEDPNPDNGGFINNPGFVIANSGVIVIDPGGSKAIGEMLLKRIRHITNLPIIAIFNTHEHGDHWLANEAILSVYPDIPIYAHGKMIDSIHQGTGQYWLTLMQQLTNSTALQDKVVIPTHAVNNADEITIDNLTFRVHYYGSSHTDNDIMVEIVELETIFLGDNVLNHRLPRLNDGNIVGNIEAINRIIDTNIKYFIPGHGPSGIENVPLNYLNYLTQLHTLVEQYYNEDLSDYEMKAPIQAAMQKYAHWYGFDTELGKNISVVFLQVEQDDF